MKSKISVLFFLFLVINGYAQKPNKGNKNEPIIIYDTISVYDTLVVYDTVKVYDKTFFQDANIVENALLTIDTTSKKTSVSLFFENDTATLSINSIILSETNKNLDTMKKEILTLMAAALLTQTSVSQTITDSTTTVNTTENTTISKNSQSVEMVVFKNKSSGKKYEVSLPSVNFIHFKNKEFRKKYLPTPSFLWGNQGTQIIARIDTSSILVKFHSPMKWKALRNQEKEMRKIQRDPNLSLKEKQDKRFAIAYPDSVSVPIESIKCIRFSRFPSANMNFYNYIPKKESNATFKHNVARTLISSIPLILYSSSIYLFATGVITFPVANLLIVGTLVTSTIIQPYLLTKKIDLNKWEIKQK